MRLYRSTEIALAASDPEAAATNAILSVGPDPKRTKLKRGS